MDECPCCHGSGTIPGHKSARIRKRNQKRYEKQHLGKGKIMINISEITILTCHDVVLEATDHERELTIQIAILKRELVKLESELVKSRETSRLAREVSRTTVNSLVGCSCVECLEKDAKNYLESLEGCSDRANTFDSIDPCQYGYIKFNEDSYESNWYPNQNDSPANVAKVLKALGISRYLFEIDSVRQFDIHWSVYIHDDEEHLIKNNV